MATTKFVSKSDAGAVLAVPSNSVNLVHLAYRGKLDNNGRPTNPVGGFFRTGLAAVGGAVLSNPERVRKHAKPEYAWNGKSTRSDRAAEQVCLMCGQSLPDACESRDDQSKFAAAAIWYGDDKASEQVMCLGCVASNSHAKIANKLVATDARFADAIANDELDVIGYIKTIVDADMIHSNPMRPTTVADKDAFARGLHRLDWWNIRNEVNDQ